MMLEKRWRTKRLWGNGRQRRWVSLLLAQVAFLLSIGSSASSQVSTNFQEHGKVTARIVSEHATWIWVGALLIILGLFALAAYLHFSRRQLRLVTERHRQLSGMLIHAEEQERHRIASELHDDFSQRLAVLALGLENVDEGIPASFNDVHQQLRKLLHSTNELGSDLHTLSRRLYSSTLESLGLVPAVAALCKEFSAQHDIKVDFISNEISRSVPLDTALCAFRVVQEGLRNSKRHSEAVEAWVELRKSGNRLLVTVRDEGCGFHVKGPHRHEGIGLRSMEERVRSVGGEFQISSSPGRGTEIRAWVPLRPEAGLVNS